VQAEADDAIHWFRQMVGAIIGLIWGIMPFAGGIFVVA
jgi:hypothetical protein